MNYSVTNGHKSDYVIVGSGKELVQIIENGPDHIHWLVVRDGATEQRIALTFSTLLLLLKAATLHPLSKRVEEKGE